MPGRDPRPRPNFNLSNETRHRMIALIKQYFLEERDTDLGDLAASLILDFFSEKMGPEYYNQGVYDAHKYMMERAEDLLILQK